MILVAITAILAVCGAAKLDRTYLPPPSAGSAGGSSDSLQTPFSRSSSGQGESSNSLPTGSYNNDFQGVVVDAAAAGIRASSDGDQSALGGPRDSYGSSNSKVGDAAFRGSVAGFRNTPTFGGSGLNGQVSGGNAGQNFGAFESKSERPQASKDRNSNIITYANDVSSDNYSYGFESDNGIAIGENGVSNNGIQAQGGYSYKGDDGQVYKVTYVADEGGYRPQGAHLPTPPPIPKEILESLEQNAKEEAAGLVDDGSYDAQKYNAEGDYTHHNGGNSQYNGAQLSQFAKQPESDVTASGTFINQNSEAFGKPGQLGNTGAQNSHSHFSGQSHQLNENNFGSNFVNNQNGLAGSQNSQSSQTLSGTYGSSSTPDNSFGQFGQNSVNELKPQFGQPQGVIGSHSSHHGSQHGQQALTNQFGTQPPQFDSQGNQQGSRPQYGGQFSQVGFQGSEATQFGGQTSQIGSSSQFGAQPNKLSFGQDSNSALNSQPSHGAQFGNQGFKPQGSFGSKVPVQQGFDKQSQYNDNKQGQSQVSQSQFGIAGLNKPSSGSSNKPSAIGQSQSTMASAAVNDNGNRFPNQFGAEYLPPFNSNNKPSYNNPLINKVPTSQNSNKGDETPNFIPLDSQNQGSPQSSSASAFASVGPTGFEPQPAKPLNTLQTQPSRPNQFNYYNNNQHTSQGQIESNALLISSQHSGSQAVPILAASETQTATPATELTSPLKPKNKPDFSQGSQSNSQSTLGFGNFGSKPISQVQPQVGSQSNIAASQQSTSQTLTPSSIDSRPQGTFQFSSSLPTQPAFSASQEPSSNEQKPQFLQNSLAQNQQNNGYYSTQKPSYNQGSDHSYHYKQPSKPFDTPAAVPQGSRFPSTPSYQPNDLTASQNSQLSNQQSSLGTKFPSSQSVAPTPSSQFTQTQGNPSPNYYNGITQASISSFPSTFPTSSTQFETTLANQFGSKPASNQLFASQTQQNRPTISQQHSDVPSFSSKPTTTSGQGPTFTQNQIQFGQSLSNNNNQFSEVQSSPSKPTTTFGQGSSTSFNQNQNQFGQSSLLTNNEPQTPEKNQEQQTISSQQYQGTIYEYNKPAEVLPAPAQSDSSSSQNVQTDLSSKPQKSQKPNYQESKPQLGQSTFFSQSQASSFNQGTKPQYGTHHFKPFGTSPSSNIQMDQNTQSTHSQTSLQHNSQGAHQEGVQPDTQNESTLVQYGQNSQAGLVSSPQFISQPDKPFGSASSPSHFGQNTQQIPGVGHTSGFTSSHQMQVSQSGEQQLGPVSGASSTNNYGQNLQTSPEIISSHEHSGSQFTAQANKPFGGAPSPSHTPQTQGVTSSQHTAQSSLIGAQSFKPFGNAGSTQGVQLNKPLGTTGTNQGFQGYPSSKPQFGSQLNHFPQSSQQTFGATQVSSKPTSAPQADALPFGNTPSIHGSPESQKPQFGQNIHSNQGSQPSGPSFGQQSIQSSQFGSQTQFSQNQNASPIKPFGSASQAQFEQSSAQATTSGFQQQHTSAQAYKPFGGSSTYDSSFQSQNKPQFDQAPQSSLGASTTSSPPFGNQPHKPFSSSVTQGSQNNLQPPQNKPFGSQQAGPCCQGSSQDSSIRPLNVGKPSQAFEQTQSQFTGFQGAQSLNAQTVAGKGEEFGGPRQPPSFDDQTGYHY